MFLFTASEQYLKPNRVEDAKDEKYHAKFAKYCIANGFNGQHQDFVKKTSIIKRFYRDEQWVMDEDVEAFLKDESGGDSGRIKVAFNIIKPLIEQYRGNAINININATAQSTSGKVKTRKDKALAEKLFLTGYFQQFQTPALQQALKDSFGVADNAGEMEMLFENAYVDAFVEKANLLIQYVANLNEFVRKQMPLAEDLAFSGLCVSEGFEHGGHLRFEEFPSELFFWDRSCYKYDLSDAQFQGRLDMADPSLIFERWPGMNAEDRKAIEDYTTYFQNNAYTWNNTDAMLYNNGSQGGSIRIPQYKVFWRDIDRHKYGWVEDEFGMPMLTKVGYVVPGDDSPKYTEKDLIDPPDTPGNRKSFFKNGKWNKIAVKDFDVLRYCIIIPSEAIQGGKPNKPNDIVLEYGIYPYQEEDVLAFDNVKFPFKVGIWSYHDGEVLSPINSVINPQRFINRILSVQESQINTSGGSNAVIDIAAIHGTNQNEADIALKIKSGKPITVNTKGKGVPNSVGKYDATPTSGTYGLTNFVKELYEFTQRTTGVNDPLQGASTGPDQLVGVTELQIQKGSLMQEPFYYALTDCFLQMFQHSATVGLKIYLDNERELVNITGPDGHEVFTLSKDMRAEQFRVFVKRDNTDEVLKSIANQELMMFHQLGLITESDFANLYGRSNPAEVMKTLRTTASAKIRLSKLNAQAMNEQAQKMMAGQDAIRDEDIAREDARQAAESSQKLAEVQAKSTQAIASGVGNIVGKTVK